MKVILILSVLWLVVPVSAQQVERLHDFPAETRDDAVAVYQKGSIYAGTGYTGFFYPLNDWWKYDLTTQEWQSLATIPFEPRQYVAATASDEHIFLLGGWKSDLEFFNDFWQYNPSTDQWTRLPSLPGPPRWSAYALYVDGSIYAGLGHDSTRFFKDWYRYDRQLKKWYKLSDFPGGGSGKGVGVIIGDKVIIGLGRDSDSFYNDFWQFDTNTLNWKGLNIDFPEKITYSSSSVSGHYMYISGGQRIDNSYTDGFWQIDMLTGNVKDLNIDVEQRRGANMVNADGDMYLLWGLNESSIRINNFYRISVPSNNDNNLMMFPNPLTDELKLRFPPTANRVEVIDISGKLLYSQKVTQAGFMTITEEELPKGLSFVRYCDGDECSQAQRLVKY